MAKRLHTPLTALLGCEVPIIQTAMGWVSTASLVTASVEAGAFGFLAAAVMSPDECEAQIKAIRMHTDKPFGVNIHAFQPHIERIIDICVDYQVPALSYGRGPSAKVIGKVRAAGIKCVPTIGAFEHARKAVELGADVLVCQGQEGGGHTGQTPTWLLLAQVLDAGLDVPIVACGGFKDGRGLAAALAFGADGVAMGTRFLLSQESPTPATTKTAYLMAEVTNIPVTARLDGLPQRMLANRVYKRLTAASQFSLWMQALGAALRYRRQTGMGYGQILKLAVSMTGQGVSIAQTLMAAQAPLLIQKAMVEGQPDQGILPSGQVAGLIDDLPACAQIIAHIIDATHDNKQRLESLYAHTH